MPPLIATLVWSGDDDASNLQTEHPSNRFETSELCKIKEDIQHIANIIGPVELVKNNHLQLSTKKKLKKIYMKKFWKNIQN